MKNMNTTMLIKTALLSLTLFITTAVTADDRPIADKELIAELKQFCKEVAKEDGTNGKDLKVFLLECVNQELNSEGYQPLTKLK